MKNDDANAIIPQWIWIALAGACILGGIWRAIAIDAPDRDVLLFFLAAGVLLILESVTKFKSGDMEIERRVKELDEKADELDKTVEELADVGPTASVRTLPAAGLTSGSDLEQIDRNVGFEDEIDRIEADIYANARHWNDDPVASLAQTNQAAGHKITARVAPSRNHEKLFLVTLDISCAHGLVPAKAAVFLHHTFPNKVRIIELEDGFGSLKLLTAGTFTIGALLPDGTKLALNLSEADMSALSHQQAHRFRTN